jgi:hypothetical protein
MRGNSVVGNCSSFQLCDLGRARGEVQRCGVMRGNSVESRITVLSSSEAWVVRMDRLGGAQCEGKFIEVENFVLRKSYDMSLDSPR